MTKLDIWNHTSTFPSAIVIGAIAGFVFLSIGATQDEIILCSSIAAAVAYWGLLE